MREAPKAAFSAGAEETEVTVSQLVMMDAEVRAVEHLWFEPAGNSVRPSSSDMRLENKRLGKTVGSCGICYVIVIQLNVSTP